MRSAHVVAIAGSSGVVLTSCATAYPGPGKTTAQFQHDVAYCQSLAVNPEAILRGISVEQCLVASGEVVKRANGTIISPPQPQMPPQPQILPAASNGSNGSGPSTSDYMPSGEIDPVTISPPSAAP